jgi:hypothetical protein
LRWWEGPKQRFLFQQLIYRTCVLAMTITIKVGLTKVGNQAKLVTYSEKSYS